MIIKLLSVKPAKFGNSADKVPFIIIIVLY